MSSNRIKLGKVGFGVSLNIEIYRKCDYEGSTSNIVSNSNSVLKWDTNGGTFKFKIKDGVEFDASSSIKVPLLFKAGTVGNLSKEGFVIVNIPAPVCK